MADASLHAYFGGRIEPVQYGRYEGTVYAHDIVSAYPSAMRDLPCLAHGEWRDSRHGEVSNFYVARMQAKTEGVIHPLPHRLEDGRVVFPPHTSGWYWKPEAETVSPHCQLESLHWHQSCNHHPFAFVDNLFTARREMKQAGNPAQLALKLVLNSLYGKTCQRLGGDVDAPPYHQLEWAGYITSSTRAKVYALAMVNPSAVVSFETDGVYATERLCEDGDGSLGSWEVTEYDEIVYVTSGLYWLRKGDTWIAKYRGLDPGSLSVSNVLEGWACGLSHVPAKRTRFRGMFTSTVSPERFSQWCQWVTEDPPPQIALYPAGKRVVLTDADPSTGLQPTMATQPSELMSHPHRLPWRNGSFPLQDESDAESRAESEEGW